MAIDFSIEKMCEHHLEEVAELEALCFSHPWSRQAFADALKDNNYRYYVALVDGHVIGMAGIIVTCDYASLTNVAVKPDYRKLGVGKSILEHIFEDAEELASFTLEVRCSNVGAIRLYESVGFENAGRRPGFYDEPKEDAFIYWKNR